MPAPLSSKLQLPFVHLLVQRNVRRSGRRNAATRKYAWSGGLDCLIGNVRRHRVSSNGWSDKSKSVRKSRGLFAQLSGWRGRRECERRVGLEPRASGCSVFRAGRPRGELAWLAGWPFARCFRLHSASCAYLAAQHGANSIATAR